VRQAENKYQKPLLKSDSSTMELILEEAFLFASKIRQTASTYAKGILRRSSFGYIGRASVDRQCGQTDLMKLKINY